MAGKLYVISGPSGVGKSTAISAVMKEYPTLKFSVSVTTRPMRPGEVDGESYYFINHEKFHEMLDQGKLLEYTEYVGNYYGTPEDRINEMLEAGIDVLMDIEPNGALQVRARRPDATLIFMAAPSFGEIERRLYGRGDTPPDKIKSRLERARWEYSQASHYDYIVINENVDVASSEIKAILLAEQCKSQFRLDYLEEDK